MKAKKSLILFLVSCLCLTLCFGLSVGAEDGADKGGMETITLVSLIIGGVVLLGVIALCIVKRKKLVESLRAYKSEMKKITWFPWKSVWRSTVLVLVVVIAVAVLVGLLDLAFFEGQYALVGIGK